MCKAMWYTGRACAHAGFTEDGAPIPAEKEKFMAHGQAVPDGDRCTKSQKTGQHCEIAKPKYKDLTRDMTNYQYSFVPDYIYVENGVEQRNQKCGICKKIDAVTLMKTGGKE
jgi:hypothetical protein